MTAEFSWQDFASAHPELCDFGASRFKEGPAFLATIRKDGSPRIHPVDPDVIDGHLLVFMEPTSPKGHDLLRDPRYTLHTYVARGGTNGEFFCRGTARAITGEMRIKLGLRAPNMKDRYVLFELFIAEARRTVYVGNDFRPIHTRWNAG